MSSDPRWATMPAIIQGNRFNEIVSHAIDQIDTAMIRDAFMRHVDLPRGPERETVRDRDREYTLRGSETRTLVTVGSFRVVPVGQLRDHDNAPAHDRSADLRHLRAQVLIEIVRVPGHRDSVVVLTKEGRELLEHHPRQPRQRLADLLLGPETRPRIGARCADLRCLPECR